MRTLTMTLLACTLALPALEKALADEEDVIREAAAWAIERVRQRYSNVNSGLPSAPSA